MKSDESFGSLLVMPKNILCISMETFERKAKKKQSAIDGNFIESKT
jgi:hypothetical protein